MSSKLEIIWVKSYYDKPLSGLCKHDGELRRFTADWEEEGYCTYPLTFFEKIKWLLDKKLFEICVGKHSTYKNGKPVAEYQKARPKTWLNNFLFKAYYRVRVGIKINKC